MPGSAVYGLLLAVVMFLLGDASPQPAGSLLLWGGLALYGVWGASILWRLTRLPFATAAVASAVLLSMMFGALSLHGHTLATPPQGIRWVVFIVALAALGPALLLIESKVHSAEWNHWKHFMENKTAWDILRGRHIPDLRATSSGRRGVL